MSEQLIWHQRYRLKQITTKSKYNTAEARCSKLSKFRCFNQLRRTNVHQSPHMDYMTNNTFRNERSSQPCQCPLLLLNIFPQKQQQMKFNKYHLSIYLKHL